MDLQVRLRYHGPMDDRLTLQHFERRLVGRRPKRVSASKRAAVAAVVRFEGGAQVLLMRRSEHPNDRWSGQVSFPGGKAEARDRTLAATAERETLEELGFSIAECATLLGPLDPVRAMAKGRVLPTIICPYVFAQTSPPTVILGEEAAHSFWLPLAPALRGELDSEYDYSVGPSNLKLPCWRYEGEVIWGLTFEMLRSLLRILSATGRPQSNPVARRN